ncbi:putative ABC transporter ATP-binding protein YknY [Austwickia sp. TVS 96-490-7B]|uniref:ABC transporter ATP-binding protein n=1 Tax=Austwickia sp. TVS 96-490-7B TaxID=2830843 RepID=UPI001C5A0921|nr:ABC transporter ATP-binding protein [Austwickia sp. TVS 96-490-7B]MBW3086907.1 putative ABC transporter ATP-binding protein YknY [Austwickia sp. TVS 96-490-7B]
MTDTVATSPDASLSLRDITRVYQGPPPVTALAGVAMDLHGGQMCCLTGASGSGKSTLLNILGMIDTPTAGAYLLNGQAVHDLDERAQAQVRRTRIGFVFQAFHLIPHLTVLDNVCLPMMLNRVPVRQRREQAMAGLEEMGLTHRSTANPKSLSGGEMQRVAIARALVMSPTVLLCDEPTGNLDRRNSAAVLDVIQGLRAPSRIIVMVTHDPEVAALGDMEVVLADGAVEKTRIRTHDS